MENAAILQNRILIISEEIKNEFTEIVAEKSDSQLVGLILAGDETAFEDVFERYKRLVAATAARYFREPEKVEEIVQISFTKAFFELKEFRGKNEFSLASWLAKITTNSCLDAIKKSKRKPENLLCEFTEAESEILFSRISSAENVENDLIERDLAEKLLSQLPITDRAILRMLFVEEMSIKEIAELTCKSRANVKVRAHRARTALRKILRKYL